MLCHVLYRLNPLPRLRRGARHGARLAQLRAGGHAGPARGPAALSALGRRHGAESQQRPQQGLPVLRPEERGHPGPRLLALRGGETSTDEVYGIDMRILDTYVLTISFLDL